MKLFLFIKQVHQPHRYLVRLKVEYQFCYFANQQKQTIDKEFVSLFMKETAGERERKKI